jgi:hypothetical protein
MGVSAAKALSFDLKRQLALRLVVIFFWRTLKWLQKPSAFLMLRL